MKTHACLALFLAAALHAPPSTAQVELSGTYIDYLGVGDNGVMINSSNHSMRYRETPTGTVCGDVWYPGSPVHEFSVEATGTVNFVARNEYSVDGFTTTSPTTVSSRSIGWSGEYSGPPEGVSVDLRYDFPADERYVVVTAVVTNTGTVALTDVHFLMSGDPDQELDLGGSFSTFNDVLRQPPTDGSALVTSGVTAYGSFYLGVGSPDARARVHAGDFSSLDPSDTWTMPQDPDGASGDIAQAVVFLESSLAVGDSVTFVLAYVWGTDNPSVEARFDAVPWGSIPRCGNGIIEGSEECDDGNMIGTDSCPTNCRNARCGDGFTWAGFEECDDGNTVDTDACLTTCTSAVCGDAIVWLGVEECDDGNTVNTDGCIDTCRDASCGDGYVWTGHEECDDGNVIDTDSCPTTCLDAECGDGYERIGVEECDDGNLSTSDACIACVDAVCGDGYVWLGREECDDMDPDNTDECIDTCRDARCGDGFIRAGFEECDDGNTVGTDACTNVCEDAECGDGYVQAGVEECDDANVSNNDACLATCLDASCGDGFIRTGVEGCDDGDADPGDGCSGTCDVEEGWVCTGEPSVCTSTGTCGDGVIDTGEECDDGNTAAGDGCSGTCGVEDGWVCTGEPSDCVPAAGCGDGLLDTGEECDDGNTAAGDGCSGSCEVEDGWVCTGEPSVCIETESCGDGALDAGEECDDGNTAPGDGCDACMVEDGWLCSGEPSECCEDADLDGACDEDAFEPSEGCGCVVAGRGDGRAAAALFLLLLAGLALRRRV